MLKTNIFDSLPRVNIPVTDGEYNYILFDVEDMVIRDGICESFFRKSGRDYEDIQKDFEEEVKVWAKEIENKLQEKFFYRITVARRGKIKINLKNKFISVMGDIIIKEFLQRRTDFKIELEFSL